MATATEIQTKIQNLEDELANAIGAHDFVSQGPDGSRTEIRNVAEYRKALREELRFWRRKLWVVQGSKTAEPARIGVDVTRNTTNGDDIT